MRKAVHHLRRRFIKRAAGSWLQRHHPCPRLRSSMMAGVKSTPARIKLTARNRARKTQIVA
jgi:hypothetical protein